jgi:uncharacterized membrane protein (UPF0182 family)
MLDLIKKLFSANFTLTAEERVGLRVSLKRWGISLGVVIIAALVFLGTQDVSPESSSLWFDVTFKAAFGLMRLALAVVGVFIGTFVGYVIFQILESSKAGSHATRYEDGEPVEVKQAKILNRGILLAVLCAVCACVIAGALSGAGGR